MEKHYHEESNNAEWPSPQAAMIRRRPPWRVTGKMNLPNYSDVLCNYRRTLPPVCLFFRRNALGCRASPLAGISLAAYRCGAKERINHLCKWRMSGLMDGTFLLNLFFPISLITGEGEESPADHRNKWPLICLFGRFWGAPHSCF